MTRQSEIIVRTATLPAMQSLVWTPDMRCPNIFWMKTLEERNRVMETERKRKMLAQLFCGDADIN